jgi:hypothetical protein
MAFVQHRVPGAAHREIGALQNRDRTEFGGWNGPGSAVQHRVPHRVRDKSMAL